MTPLAKRISASSPFNSFCVAHGKAISARMCQGVLPSKYSKPCFDANSEIRPRLIFFSSITSASNASVKPFFTKTVPFESDRVTTFAPKNIAFSAANCATFPEPEIETVFPAKLSPRVFSISSAK